MSDEYFILKPDGTRAGPFAEEEVLDLLDSGDAAPDDQCLHGASGRVSAAGAMFQVIEPEAARVAPPAPVAWQPAPFPDEEEDAAAEKPRARLLYHGNPSVLTYWRSVLLAAACVAGGDLLRGRVPAMLAIGLVAGSLVLIRAILHRLSTQYFINSARVEVITGLLSRSSRELRIADIRAINVTRTGLTGLLGIGSITFSSAAGAQDDVVFHRIFGASGLKNLVRRLQDGDL